ncbi:leucine-rich repeat-containing protein 74A-like isoform X1 [Gigantopelta aegis]|uniref:leucine-rich repeat-containing protein 74A-like isoform X1 n=1 Tax=Gigantopelta aegis TaxID=1735272 RepID=UPI001B88C2D4|nr:leucine-rich repeat-containing protein 74A-like isoform X1 [Gigantopelta aegis]
MADTRLKGYDLPKIHEKRKKTSRTKSASTDVSRSQKSSCRRSANSAKPADSSASFDVRSTPSICSLGSRQSLHAESSVSATTDPSSIDVKREKLKSGKFGPYFQNYFPGVSRKKPVEVRELSDDEDYDTDLEEDLDKHLLSQENVICSEDHGLFYDYKKLCRKLKVVPNTFFIRHAMEDRFTMKHRYPAYNDVRALMHDIQTKDTISSLNLEDNGIGPSEMLHLGQMLLHSSSIIELKLTDNKIGTFGARLLKTVLLYNRHIVKIDIAGNNIGEKGAKYFAETLERNVYLKELNLAHNSIAEQGALYLGQAIGANHTLDFLDISWNNITPRGATLFARGLKINLNLKILKVAMNGFHVHGTEALADVLKTNQSLECLDISANRIPQDGALAIARALTHNKGLKALKIGFNPLTVEGARAILDAVSGKHVTAIKEVDFEGVVLKEDFGVAAINVIENCNIDVIYVVQPSRRSKSFTYLDKVVKFLNEINVQIHDLFGDVKETNVILSSADVIQRLKKNIKDVSEEKVTSLTEILGESGNKRFLLHDLLQAAQKRKSEKEKIAMTPLTIYSPRPAKNPVFARSVTSLWWSQAETAWGNQLVGTDMKVPSLLTT